MQKHYKSLILNPLYGKLFAIIIVCCLGAILYSNSLHNSFHLDDKESIIENLDIRDHFNLRAIWNFWPTRFIPYFSLALNYRFSQLNVFDYHLVNIIIHLSTAILVWWLVLITFSTPVIKKNKIASHSRLIAFLVGLVFVAHPIQTEVVTYIVQRAASLAALFYLLSLCLYIKSRLLYKNLSLKTSRFCYIASLAACIIAIFSKEIVITLPLIILLYEFYFLKDKESMEWKTVTPFLFFILIIPLTMFMTKSVNFMEMRRISESMPRISSLPYLLTEFRVIVTYLRLFFVPINQNLDYDYPISKSLFEVPTLISLLFLILIIFTAMRLFRKHRLISFSIFWVFLTLLPESSIIPIKDVIFEHRLYLPMFGYSLFLVTTIYYFFGKKSIIAMILILGFTINWYALLTYNRNYDWHDGLTLWDDTVHKSPRKARPYFNRGIAYANNQDYSKAFSDFDRALMLCYKQLGKTPDYTKTYNKLLKSDYAYAELYNFLALKYAEIRMYEYAAILFKKAIETNPSNIEYYVNLSAAYGDLKKFKKAIEIGKKATELEPNLASVHYNLSVAYYFNGEYNLALSHLERAEKLGVKSFPEFLRILQARKIK